MNTVLDKVLREVQKESNAVELYYSIDGGELIVVVTEEELSESAKDILQDKLSNNAMNMKVEVTTFDSMRHSVISGVLDYQLMYSEGEWL